MGTSTFQLADRFVDLSIAKVQTPRDELPLSPIEVKLLAYLADRPDQIVGREELLQCVWGYRDGIRSRTIDNTVRRLRLKLEPDPNTPVHLQVIYGQGLLLTGLLPTRAQRPSVSGLFGRTHEMEVLRSTLAQGARLVTLCGPPGVGKTRLALEIARERSSVAVFARIGANDPDTVVADALGIACAGEVERLLPDTIASRGELILILDECELQSESVLAAIERWGRRAPAMQVLATSRIPLVADGYTLSIAPLDEDSAIALFISRYREQDTHPIRSVMNPHTARTFARLVGCSPLALELGAIRAAAVGAEALLELGASGMGGVVNRSIEAQDERSRGLLIAVSVFESSFTLEDAAAVSGAPPAVVADGLALLVRDHLLYREVPAKEGACPVRYALFALVREAARMLLDPSVVTRRAEHFARLGSYEISERSRSDVTLRRIYRLAKPDLRSICDRPGDLDPEIVAQCALALVTQLSREGPFSEARTRALALSRMPCSDRTLAGLARIEAVIALLHNDTRWAYQAASCALAFAREPEIIVELRSLCATCSVAFGQMEQAKEILASCEPLLPTAGPAVMRYYDAVAYATDSYEIAQEATLAAARVARRYGDGVTEARSLVVAGHNAVSNGVWHVAKGYFDRAIAIHDALGIPSRSVGLAMQQLGQFERHRGRLQQAETLLRESIAYSERLGDLAASVSALIDLALVFVARKNPAEAAPLLERAMACAEDEPGQQALLLWCASAEAALAEHNPHRARSLLDEAMRHARTPSAQAMALDLLAVAHAMCGDLPLAREQIARAERASLRGTYLIRHRAIAALVCAMDCDRLEAAQHLQEARASIEALEAGPGSHLTQWIVLAERALANAVDGGPCGTFPPSEPISSRSAGQTGPSVRRL